MSRVYPTPFQTVTCWVLVLSMVITFINFFGHNLLGVVIGAALWFVSGVSLMVSASLSNMTRD